MKKKRQQGERNCKMRLYKESAKTIICISLCIISFLFWGINKQGYFIDEVYSFGISNGEYGPYINNYAKDHDYILHKADIENYLTVSESTIFDYSNVYNNTSIDNGAPFYYMLFHSVCSLDVGEFNKWMGLSINFIFYLLSLLFIWEISFYLYNNKDYATSALFLFGLSTTMISIAMMVRLYMLFVFETLLMVWLFLPTLKNKPKAWRIILILITLFVGLTTHYLFLNLVLSIVLFGFIQFCFKKHRETSLSNNHFILYGTIIIVTIITLLFFTPFSKQFISNDHIDNGLTMFNNLLNPSLWFEKGIKYGYAMCLGMPAAVILCVISLIKFIFRSIKQKNVVINDSITFILLIIIVVSITTIISAPHTSFRYIANVVSLLSIPAAKELIDITKKSAFIRYFALSIIFFIPFVIKPQFIYSESASNNAALTPYSNSICVFQCKDPMNHRSLTWHLPYLSLMKESLIAGPDMENQVNEFISESNSPNHIIVYTESLCNIEGYNPAVHLFDWVGCEVWRFDKQPCVIK